MEKMSKYDEFIQPFLDGELSREELDWFSKELSSNAVLAEDIRLYREVDNAIREQDVMELRDQLDVIHNSIGDPSVAPTKQSRYRRVLSYGAIASLAIFLSLGVLLKVQHNKLTNDQIHQAHFQDYDLDLFYRGDDEADKTLHDAASAYEAKDYLTAIPYFEELLGLNPNDMQTRLGLGISYLKRKDIPKAKGNFQTIINQGDNMYIEPAEWYLGHCYLETGQNLVARNHFKKIAKSDSYYKKQAKTVLRKIK